MVLLDWPLTCFFSDLLSCSSHPHSVHTGLLTVLQPAKTYHSLLVTCLECHSLMNALLVPSSSCLDTMNCSFLLLMPLSFSTFSISIPWCIMGSFTILSVFHLPLPLLHVSPHPKNTSSMMTGDLCSFQ